MSLTIVITRDVQSRYRGFLGSMMLEVAAGVYVSPRLNREVRVRLWDVLEEWHKQLSRGGIIMLWRDKSCPGYIDIKMLGESHGAKEFYDIDGFLLTRNKIKPI